MEVSIDPEGCTGHGRCYSLAPELFEPDDMGQGVVVHPTVPEGLEGQARVAVEACPERAVHSKP